MVSTLLTPFFSPPVYGRGQGWALLEYAKVLFA
jgi:hypothetical protein